MGSTVQVLGYLYVDEIIYHRKGIQRVYSTLDDPENGAAMAGIWSSVAQLQIAAMNSNFVSMLTNTTNLKAMSFKSMFFCLASSIGIQLISTFHYSQL